MSKSEHVYWKVAPRDTNMASEFPFNIAHILSNFDTLGKKIHKGEEIYIFFGTQMQLFINGLKKVFFWLVRLREYSVKENLHKGNSTEGLVPRVWSTHQFSLHLSARRLAK